MASGTKQAPALLGILHEPSFIVDRHGTVLFANRAATQLMGADFVQQPLSQFVVGDTGSFDLYMRRCFGSPQPLIGSVTLRTIESEQKFSCRGGVFFEDEDRFALVRLASSSDSAFAALTRTVEELRGELKKRQRSEAILAETVRERELLFRELEHRVKNNMQMLASMLYGAERESSSEEAKTALRDASARFSAVSAIQQLLYRSETLTTVCSEALVSTLLQAVETMAPHAVETRMAVERMQLPIDAAVPIGLVLNELLTNSIKHGRPDQATQSLHVSFGRVAGQIEMVVKDNGPGFDLSETRKRASGIGLVRGLLRQLGGSLRVERDDGARCVVTFADPGTTASRNFE